MSSPRAGRSTAVAMLWFVLLALAATGPALFLDRSLGPEGMIDSDPLFALGEPPSRPIVSDSSRASYDLPHDFAAADGFRAGRFDLWNPRIGLGVPLWAEGGAPFFPLKLPFYLAPSRRTYDLATALRLVIAGLGAYLLARRRGLAPLPALGTGTVFELSGATMALMPFGSGAPASLLPWVVLGAAAIAQDRTLRAAAGAGLALGVTMNSGHPMVALITCAAFGAATLGEAMAAWRTPRTLRSIVALACVAVVLALLVGAPTLLPLLELQGVARVYKSTLLGFGLTKYMISGYSRAALPIALFAPAVLISMREPLTLALPYILSPVVGLLGLAFPTAGILRRGLG